MELNRQLFQWLNGYFGEDCAGPTDSTTMWQFSPSRPLSSSQSKQKINMKKSKKILKLKGKNVSLYAGKIVFIEKDWKIQQKHVIDICVHLYIIKDLYIYSSSPFDKFEQLQESNPDVQVHPAHLPAAGSSCIWSLHSQAKPVISPTPISWFFSFFTNQLTLFYSLNSWFPNFLNQSAYSSVLFTNQLSPQFNSPINWLFSFIYSTN